MEKFTGLIRRCVEDYNMISDGDRIAVGLSGGKDSTALLCALAKLRGYYPEKFELSAVTLDLGISDTDYRPLRELTKRLGVPYEIVKTRIGPVIFEERNEKNPCSLCAKMRRGALSEALLRMGVRKVALGHHFDDAVETFVLSLFYEGRISCFQPVTHLDRMDILQIRPMIYISEDAVRNLAARYGLPVVKNPCPMNGHSKRQEIKELLITLGTDYPSIRNKIFGAMQRLPLRGWEPEEYARRPLPDIE